MKKQSQQFPPGWDEARARTVAEYYENQTDDEAFAEHEKALSRPDHTLMPIPHDLVPEVRRLLADHGKKAS